MISSAGTGVESVVSAGSVAAYAALLADRTRAAMCLALLDGRAWTSGELARHTGVAASTASEHASAMVAAGLLAEERQGRHRYLRLAGPQTAQLVEDLAAAVGVRPAPTSLRTARVARDLAWARTCYDHLAGALGVALLDALAAAGLITTTVGTALTPAGRSWFTDLGCAAALDAPTRRPLVRTCLDWTERRPDLAGALGAALHDQLQQRGWTSTRPSTRAVTLTDTGRTALQALLPITLPDSPRPLTAGGS